VWCKCQTAKKMPAEKKKKVLYRKKYIEDFRVAFPRSTCTIYISKSEFQKWVTEKNGHPDSEYHFCLLT